MMHRVFSNSNCRDSFEGSSVIRTISAASIAASEPKPPMATPISALARTGALLPRLQQIPIFVLETFYFEVILVFLLFHEVRAG